MKRRTVPRHRSPKRSTLQIQPGFAIVAAMAAVIMIAFLPDPITDPTKRYGGVFWISSLVTLGIVCVAVFRSRSIVSAETLVAVVWVMRFFVPAALYSPEVQLTSVFSIVNMPTQDDFFRAGIAANAGVCAALAGIGFVRTPNHSPMTQNNSLREFRQSSLLVFLLGTAAMLLFVSMNSSSLGSALSEGSMRGADVVSGTGPLFYLGLAIIPGSVAYAYCELALKGRVTMAFLLVLVATFMSLILLGGRVRALLPVVSIVFVWLAHSGRDRISAGTLIYGALGYLGLLSYLALGQAFRTEGIDGVLASDLNTISDYARWSIVAEMGQLHGIFVPLAEGEDYLGGETYYSLFWPLSEFAGLSSPSTGVLVVELARGPMSADADWGFHPSMIGDAILNGGRWWIVGHCFVFGLALGLLKASTVGGTLSYPVRVLLTLGLIRAFSESTDKVSEVNVYIGFLVAIYFLAQVIRSNRKVSVSRLSPGHPGRRRVQRSD